MKRTIILRFPPKVADQPIVYSLMTRFKLWVNIHRALVEPGANGVVVIAIDGSEDNIRDAISYAEEKGVQVTLLEHDIVLRDGVCVQCGACISLCPSKALTLDKNTYLLSIDYDKCVACGTCASICPVDAIEVNV